MVTPTRGGLRAWVRRQDLKSLFLVLSFLGLGSVASWWGGAQRVTALLIGATLEAQAAQDSIRTVGMIRKSESAIADSMAAQKKFMELRFNRLERMVVLVPEVQRGFRRDSIRQADETRLRLRRAHIFPRESRIVPLDE